MKIGDILTQQLNQRYVRCFPNADLIAEKRRILNLILEHDKSFMFEIKDQEKRRELAKKGFDGLILDEVSNNLKNNYANMINYFLGLNGELDLSKSLYLHGNTGCGKTLAMNVFKKYTSERLRRNSFKKVSMVDIIRQMSSEGLEAIDRYIRQDGKPISLYIEDFGTGNHEVKNFGTNINPIDELIDRRYRLWKDTNYPTHFCSNIDKEDIEEVLSQRVSSRLYEMCNFIDFTNIDFRKL